MVNEVESILNEIRERVRKEHEPANAPLTLDPSVQPAPASLVHPNSANSAGKGESLNRLSAHLTATARAWTTAATVQQSQRNGSEARTLD